VVNILIQISNNDDKLPQSEWAQFIAAMRELLDWPGVQIHGEWFSRPDGPWQNANWCVEAADDSARSLLRRELRVLRERYRQESIGWTEGEIELLGEVSDAG
jgi:hypothetical protein